MINYRKTRMNWNNACRLAWLKFRCLSVEIHHEPECSIAELYYDPEAWNPFGFCDCNPKRIINDPSGGIFEIFDGAGPFHSDEILEALK